MINICKLPENDNFNSGNGYLYSYIWQMLVITDFKGLSRILFML